MINFSSHAPSGREPGANPVGPWNFPLTPGRRTNGPGPASPKV